MATSLRDQVALVTGGGTGIGRQIALALGNAGATVCVAGRRREPLEAVVAELEARDARGRAQVADVRDPRSVQELVEGCERELGAVDLLVNNAATFARGPVAQLDPARWNDVIATNLSGAFLVTRAVLPGMMQRRKGSIVFVSSTSGKRGDANASAYSASKFGLMGLAQSLLYEVRRHDIRVVVVSPSAIDTSRDAPDPTRVQGATAHAADVAETVVHCLTLPPRALIRDVEIWGTNP